MTVKIDWLIEGQIIYHYWSGIGTIEDIIYVNQRTLEFYQEYPDRPLIHTIVNAVDQKNTEVGIQSGRNAMPALDHPQTGWIIMLLDNRIFEFVSNIMLQIKTKTRFRIRKDTTEGIKFLKTVDPSINWENANWSIIEQFKIESTEDI